MDKDFLTTLGSILIVISFVPLGKNEVKNYLFLIFGIAAFVCGLKIK